MRFDDTNPEKEDQEYVDSILDAVKWLGFTLGRQRHQPPVPRQRLLRLHVPRGRVPDRGRPGLRGRADAEEMRANRGDFSKPGTDSPFRSRSHRREPAALSRHARRQAGRRRRRAARQDRHGQPQHQHARPGASTASAAPRTTTPATSGASTRCTPTRTRSRTRWRTSPTASARWSSRTSGPFYDWLLDRLGEGGLINQPHPRQYEFARLNLTYVITSKRKLKQLVDEKHVSGWDDPRMPTIVGLRRRGYTPESLQLFAERIGVTKSDSWIDYAHAGSARCATTWTRRRRGRWRCWTR